MAKPMSLDPVFEFEWLAVSRRWQWYAARSVFVLGVLAALSVVWWARAARTHPQSVQGHAELGRRFCGAILATQLAMVLLVAPAATAGAICLDRARGTLAHMLMTDLSSVEIIVGKLTARMVPVTGILLCFLPIPALASLMGGIDLTVVAGSVLVTVGVAACGCAGALALSTWGTKTHEVLLATYAAWALWLLALPMWWGHRLAVGGSPPPHWLERANPIWLVGASVLWPGSVTSGDQFSFFGASVLISAALTALATWQLRNVTTGRQNSLRSVSRWSRLAAVSDGILSLVPGPSLDANPVLWREWHRRRGSRWSRAVWLLHGTMTIGLSVTLITLSANGNAVRRSVASVGNGFQAGIGLLLLSVSAATALAEERVRGNLDILLTTPLTTRSIVWGKWWGTFRTVPLLAICPGAVAIALARESGRWEGAFLIVGLFLAYGAAVTSLGLALATWVNRLDFAVALNVAVLGAVTVGWLLAVALTVPGPSPPGLAAGSPIVGITLPTIAMKVYSAHEWAGVVKAWGIWITVYVVTAALLAWGTDQTFDRCLGRGRTANLGPVVIDAGNRKE
jgi:ABC-type transport system involved in multi-copper enzyme maturation permease subunit